MKDLIIIGGGPAGVAAGVYAARKQLKTTLITKEWGGQSSVSTDIQNWVGTISISGDDLAKALKAHLDAYKGEYVEVSDGALVNKIEKSADGFIVGTEDGKSFEGKTVLICAGADRKKLDVPGAAEFDQKGLTYCASCDGPLFANQDVVVIGGGNAAFETAAQLLAYTKSVTLLNRSPQFKADPVTVEKVLKNPKMKALLNAETVEIKGDKFVNGLIYKDKESADIKNLTITGVFVEIGLVPNTSFVEGLLEMDKINRIKVNGKNQQTSLSGIWAAGDCTDELYHQNNIAAGDAVKALEDIYNHLHTR
ncbi:MAG: FAD-dependent oxidoreductase [Parcubacteria group bacterium]|nr:FAD-dependent oxidoreductase [Parcubacteria group bacterium]